MSVKEVAVIGCGISGLNAVKALKDEGLEPVCFERTGDIGGPWRYHEDVVDGLASVMRTTIINTSKELGAASNCPPPAEYPNCMHHSLMYEYILSIGIKFDCLRHVRYPHEAVKIEKSDDYEETGKWKVTNRNTQTGELVSEVFDCVTVCIGHHVYPNEPTFPKQEEFERKIIHTHSLKKVGGYEDQRIVVVGSGNSGMDAAVELSAVAKKTETEVDSVILVTGYLIKFPFLSDDVIREENNRVQLYKFIYPPHLPHPTLAILGLIQPSGPDLPVGEMQCRWTARIMVGRHTLPPHDKRIEDIKSKEEYIRRRFVDSPRHTLQIDFIAYQDELAEEIGAKPNFFKLAFNDPKLFWALFTGPYFPYQCRLQGPHPWEGAREAILTHKDRLVKPLQRPGQPVIRRKRSLLYPKLVLQILFLLPILCIYFACNYFCLECINIL